MLPQAMSVDNCKRCNRVFRKQLSPYCADCYQNHMLQFDKIYHYLQKFPNQMVHIHDIAGACDIHFREVEQIFFSGRLGLAGNQILYNCQMCEVPITPVNKGRKRLCAHCSIKMEIEGKLHLSHDKDGDEDEQMSAGVAGSGAKAAVHRSDDDYEKALLKKKEEAEARAAQARDKSSGHSYGFKRLSM